MTFTPSTASSFSSSGSGSYNSSAGRGPRRTDLGWQPRSPDNSRQERRFAAKDVQPADWDRQRGPRYRIKGRKEARYGSTWDHWTQPTKAAARKAAAAPRCAAAGPWEDAASDARTGAAAQPEDALPAGWTEFSTETGVYFYQNQLTGDMSWTRPTEAATDKTARPPGEAREARNALPPGWIKLWSKDGEIYHYNTLTQEGSSKRPVRAAADSAAGAPQAGARPEGALPAGWNEFFSAEHGQWYYHNTVTGQTCWTRPMKPATGKADTAPLAADPEAAALAKTQSSRSRDGAEQALQNAEASVEALKQELANERHAAAIRDVENFKELLSMAQTIEDLEKQVELDRAERRRDKEEFNVAWHEAMEIIESCWEWHSGGDRDALAQWMRRLGTAEDPRAEASRLLSMSLRLGRQGYRSAGS